MRRLPVQKRTLSLLAVLIPLLTLFAYVALRSGPLAPVSIVLATVAEAPISPALFGIGTVEARYAYKIGPTYAGRVKRLEVDVGDQVKAGQVLGEMDPVDFDDRIRAQEAALKRARAQLVEAQARMSYARTQARRYEELLKARSTSEETVATKKQELAITEAALQAAREEIARVGAEGEALLAERGNLKLIAPADGLIVARNVEPGTAVVAGEVVVESIDPASLWINVRFDQIRAQGLAANLPARITLRSQSGEGKAGRVLRVEPVADEVTEELLAKVVFDKIPEPLPPIGELAEVTVELPALPPEPIIPNAAIKRIDGTLGVWRSVNRGLRFTPVTLGSSDLDGEVQVREGLTAGDQVVAYSEKALHARSRIRITERLPGTQP
ncbi:MAG: efflux RND transporter periplasmic adaptor subunit [Desulfuromonadales bacterium]